MDDITQLRDIASPRVTSFMQTYPDGSVATSLRELSMLAKPNTYDLILANLKYSYNRYFVSQVLFMTPYTLLQMCFGQDVVAQSTFGQLFGLLSIAVWCGYGLFTTKQFRFVLVASVLFFLSQIAYYTGYYALDIVLTLSCAAVIAVKQYFARHYTYNLIRYYDTTPFQIKDTGKGFVIYRRHFNFCGYFWWKADCQDITGTIFPRFETKEQAERVVAALHRVSLNR